MAEGIYAEVADGFARIQFMDKSLVGDGLARLLAIGGPGLIEVDTRTGARKIYIVPESIAQDAGLLEAAPVEKLYPEGDPSDAWTVPQLREYAEAKGIALGEATKKADILAVLAPKPA